MPVLIRSRSPWNPTRHPVLVVTWRKRTCGWCGGKSRITLFSPSAWCFPRFLGTDPAGHCCLRCTRGLRSEAGL
jgi:hypothetical protein